MSNVKVLAAAMVIAFCLIAQVSPAEESEGCKLAAIEGPHATAVVYRYRAFVASARHASIYVDEKKVCSLTNGRYVVIPLTPGEHRLRGSDPKHGGTQQVFKEGLAYYFRVFAQPTGFFQSRNFWVLAPVPPETAQVELGAIKPEDAEVKPLPKLAAPMEMGVQEAAK